MYKKLLLNILLILLILAVIAIIVNFFWQLKPNQSNDRIRFNDNQPINNTTDNVKPLPQPVVLEPATLNRYEGTIKALDNNTITLSTVFGEKIVKFDNNTIWKKIFLSNFPPAPGQNNVTEDLPDPEIISPADATVGQMIEIVSDTNISGQTNFLVTEINLIVKI